MMEGLNTALHISEHLGWLNAGVFLLYCDKKRLIKNFKIKAKICHLIFSLCPEYSRGQTQAHLLTKRRYEMLQAVNVCSRQSLKILKKKILKTFNSLWYIPCF